MNAEQVGAEYDFDTVIDRTGLNAIAVDGFREYLFDGDDVTLPCPDSEVLAMWVADMAFASAPAATDAMRERLDRPVFGYTVIVDDGPVDAFVGWCNRRYGWAPSPEHVLPAAGIVPALNNLVEYILQPGGAAVTLTPAYGPFETAATRVGRELLTSALVESSDGYSVDFADLETKLTDPTVGLFILCHPHNPTGRVWDEGELCRMAELCFEHDVLVISDEIHCDLLRTGLTHTPLAKLFPDSDQIITCMSSSKTFNLAGLGIANVIIPNNAVRAVWEDMNFPAVNPLSVAAASGAFLHGDEWLDQLKLYLDDNFTLVARTLEAELPNAVFQIPDATYLAWVDLSAYFPVGDDLTRHFAERCGVLVEGGEQFVADGDGHIRINLACPRSILEQALSKIVAATPAA